MEIITLEKRLKNAGKLWFLGSQFDHSYLLSLNKQLNELGFDFKLKFKPSEQNKLTKELSGNLIVLSSWVQARLILIARKCKENGLDLCVCYRKLSPEDSGILHLLIQQKGECIIEEKEDYIWYVFDENNQDLMLEIYKHCLVYYIQRSVFTDEKDREPLKLISRVESFLINGTWFQIIDKSPNGEFYLRAISHQGRRTYLTVWLTKNDIDFLKNIMKDVIQKISSNPACKIGLYVKSEQKRGDSEGWYLWPHELLELIENL